ncbi:TlpA disulfide reductase family protein [soil metagenome]
MKKLLFALLGLLPVITMAQAPTFSLSGKVGKLNAPAKVYFDYMDNGVSNTDSVVPVNGVFKFKGSISSGYGYVRMGLSHDGTGKERAVYGGDVIYFYIGNENIMISSKDSLVKATISGSKVNDAYNAYNKEIGGTIMELTKAVNIAFSAGTPEQQKDSLFFKGVDKQYRKNINDRADKQVQYAIDHPGNYFSIVALSEAAGTNRKVLSIEPVYDALSDELKNTDQGKELAARISAERNIVVGAPAPVFTQNNFAGNPVSSKDLYGKYLLVEFWASWCGPCRAENPNLLEQYTQYKDKGFDILGVSLDDDKKKWAKAIEQDGIPWTQVSDLKGWNNEIGRLYGVRAVPASFLLDREGKIIGINLRGEALNKKLAELFQ